ncbi:hypothetical protein [Zobellia galactanivorans]|uniref:Uncharacterized protein n=1 Tax=Zobellia galactanivorans (strain DSM 12802 / CCUG 47099 / CIP 106680 / NCIMB 13871 / Dsij) TaxID=63186 RepID=G0L0I6_ZOBGA|nr:hypothetical protein [Zobellia galactanivorans]CAZ97424.1 Conserved hypothetical protein [Zobellia galactanivorans]
MYRGSRLKLYREGNLKNLFGNSARQIESQINQKSESYILNVSEVEFAEFLIQSHIIDFPVLDFENVFVESYEKDIPAESFPGNYDVYRGKTYRRDVIVYHIPYTGDIYILGNQGVSSFSISGSIEVGVTEDSITTEIINFNSDPEKIKRDFEDSKRYILSDYHILKKDCEGFNNEVLDFAIGKIKERKQKLLSKNDLLSSLGVPLKKKVGVAETFSIPKPELRKKIKIEPKVYEKGFKPEPTLSNENYQEILKIINDVGKNFERMPSTYIGKGEEDLRDHILLILDPNFEFGSASGETFNKKGKTDILLKYDSDVVFIAECKFWAGKGVYLSTIDQLLGYLTFRNSKTSLVIFVRNKDMSNVITTISEVTETHPNYIRTEKKNGETWWNYIFHINDDRNREINLGVLAFHLPD